MLRRFPKSRLPGPAARWFEIEQSRLELAAAIKGVTLDELILELDDDQTVRVSYDDDTARVIVG